MIRSGERSHDKLIFMILDTHQHFWKASRGDYHWMTPADPVLARDYLPDDLRPELQKAGVTKTIVVQAAQTVAETEYLLEIGQHPKVFCKL
jgi:L-fuconolactonase